jgi:hypothetical protein
MTDLSINTISIQDVLETYRDHGAAGEEREAIFSFISDLTGISEDRLAQYLNEMEKAEDAER